MQNIFEIKDEIYMNGERFQIISGSIHYFRVVPEYWRDRLEKLKAMGCNTVETYVAWNVHEPREGEFCFEDGADLCKFIEIAQELGFDKDDIFILSSGNVLELDDNGAQVTGQVPVGSILVDGLGVGDVGNIVLRDRQHLAEDGIIIIVMTLESGSGQVLAGPDIVSRGFVYVRGSESLMDEAKKVLDGTMDYCMSKNITDWGRIKTEIKDELGEFVWKKTKRRPMIMPIIMEV